MVHLGMHKPMFVDQRETGSYWPVTYAIYV